MTGSILVLASYRPKFDGEVSHVHFDRSVLGFDFEAANRDRWVAVRMVDRLSALVERLMGRPASNSVG